MMFNKQIFGFLLLTGSLMAQPQGTNISYTVNSDKGANGTMQVFYQKGNSRMEIELKVTGAPIGPVKVTTIVQSEKPNTTLQVYESSKTYTEIVAPEGNDKKEDTKEYVVTVLGKEKIGTYNCTHVKVAADKASYEMWLTKDLTPTAEFYHSNNKYVGNEKMQKSLAAKQADGFPVKTIYSDVAGRDGAVTLTLTKFEKMNVPADKFQVPAGYTKATTAGVSPVGMPGQSELMNMSPEEREKLIEQMKKQYGGQK